MLMQLCQLELIVLIVGYSTLNVNDILLFYRKRYWMQPKPPGSFSKITDFFFFDLQNINYIQTKLMVNIALFYFTLLYFTLPYFTLLYFTSDKFIKNKVYIILKYILMIIFNISFEYNLPNIHDKKINKS